MKPLLVSIFSTKVVVITLFTECNLNIANYFETAYVSNFDYFLWSVSMTVAFLMTFRESSKVFITGGDYRGVL